MSPFLSEQESCLIEQTSTYRNPIIPGFAPDPSVVLVDGTFFLVTSSFHIFPGIPIYASKDLQTWVHIGNAINRASQIDLTNTLTKVVPLHEGGHMIGAGGLFAPTIRYHESTFYIVCTNVGEEGEGFEAENFIISTRDIWRNEWSDPIHLDLHGIDPSLFVDADGKAYLQGSFRLERTEQPTSTIKQYEIDLKTGKRLSDIREIWPGHAKTYTEGPHIYKKDGYYYLLVAEGGTFEHHLLSIARATNMWGPYESCPNNPILTAFGKNEDVQDAGHGEFFQDEAGMWWATVLGVRKDGKRYPMGRESFLCPVEWPKGQWPQVGHPQIVFKRAASSSKATKWWSLLSGSPRVDDCYIRSPLENNYKFSDSGVSLRPTAAKLSAPTGTTTFVGKRQRSKTCSSSAVLVSGDLDGAQPLAAGLVVYKDDVRHAGMLFDSKSGTLQMVLRNNNDEDQALAEERLCTQPESLQLHISASTMRYEFWWRVGGKGDWSMLGQIDTAEMTCQDFTGTIFGLHAYSAEPLTSSWVHFRDFEVRASS